MLTSFTKKELIKLIITFLLMMIACIDIAGQDIKKDNKTFSYEKIAKTQDIHTEYTWVEDGVRYDIYLHKNTKGKDEGKWKAYIYKNSKNGNVYKKILPKEVSEQIINESYSALKT